MRDEQLMAVVTLNKDVVGGDVPIFFAENEEQQSNIATTLAKVLKGMVHDIGNGAYIIVRH
ncbi:capping complex subunit for YIEGIA [Phosphitispora sp. TUW77]|uniref:capping complex subunit for YIEGIA n=1 Tax=Phosphitispora sp. TUW77 TaxID=3152361 RepID=UPI003AB36A11